MLLCVPDPVCHTESGNSASWRPASTSSAARWIASALPFSRRLSSALTAAAAFLTRARAWITASGMRSPEMRKNRKLRSGWAPQRRSAGPSVARKLSFSMRLPPIAADMLLLQQAAQHPGVLFVNLHALGQEVERGLRSEEHTSE